MRDTTPWSEGSPDAKILFIAEAPGKDEVLQGRPLVGLSGEIFNECLLKAGILRSQRAVVNTIKEQIPSPDAYLSNGMLTVRGLEAAKDLYSRIAGYKPNIIVTLGALPLACMAPSTKAAILKWRGSIIPATSFRDHKLIPSLHPAFCLPYKGSYTSRFTIAKDFKRVAAQAEFPEIRRRKRTLITAPSFSDVLAFIHECHNHEKVASDLETLNHQVSCFSLCYNPDVSMSIPMMGRAMFSDYWSESQEAEIWRAYAELLHNRNVTKVWHNGTAFDIPFLFMQNHILSLPNADTMVQHRILYPDFSAKLEYVCSVFTDQIYYKDDRKMWMNPSKDPDAFWRYNATDSSVTMEAEPQMAEMIAADPHYSWTYKNTMDSFEPCLYAGMRGFRIDKERLGKLLERVKGEIQTKQAALNEMAGMELAVNSSPQCIKFFYGTKGYHPYINRKTGSPTCDDKALARIVRKYDSKEARLVQELRSLNKLRSTYLEIKTDADGRLRYVYDIRGTTTGRYSSKQTPIGTGANSQNLDPRMKDFIVVEA